MNTKTIEKYFLFSLLSITFVFTFFIFRPFWVVIVLGASFAVILYPFYNWLNKKISSTISALITLLLFILILFVPILSISSIIFKQSENVYTNIVANDSITKSLESISTDINNFLPEGIAFNANEIASTFASFLTSNIGNIFNASISVLISLILLFLSIFYFLKDGNDWKQKIILMSPLSKENNAKIINGLSKTINSVIFGYLLIGLIQGVLMWVGLSIFGVPNAVFWGLVAAIAALIPPFGTSIVSIPAVIYLYATGHPLPALGLLAWGIIMVGTIDNILNPYIIGKKIEMSSFLILFSVLGGISLLGPIGILIGPLTVSVLHTLILIYKDESNENNTL